MSAKSLDMVISWGYGGSETRFHIEAIQVPSISVMEMVSLKITYNVSAFIVNRK